MNSEDFIDKENKESVDKAQQNSSENTSSETSNSTLKASEISTSQDAQNTSSSTNTSEVSELLEKKSDSTNTQQSEIDSKLPNEKITKVDTVDSSGQNNQQLNHPIENSDLPNNEIPAFEIEETVISSLAVDTPLEMDETVVSAMGDEEFSETQKVDIISDDENKESSTESTVEISMQEVFSKENSDQANEDNENNEDNEPQEIDGRRVLFPGDAIKKIKETGVIEDAVIPFLNLDGLEVKQLVIRNCQLQGIVARGATFLQEVSISGSEIMERLEFSAWKQTGGLAHTTFHKGFSIKNSLMRDNVSMRNARVTGDVVFDDCELLGTVRLDQSKIEGNVVLAGNSDILHVSAFRCTCQEFKISRHKILGLKKESLDLNSAKIGKINLSRCILKQAFKMKKARIGNEDIMDAMYVSGCEFDEIDISQSMFFSKIYWHATTVHGKFLSEMPKEEKGRKIGKPVFFKEDAHLDNVVFKAKTVFYGTRFAKYARFVKCIFEKQANFNQVDFQDVSSFWTSEFHGKADFKKAMFGGRSNFGKVKFYGKNSFNEANFVGEANFYLADVKQDIFFTGASFEDNLVLRNISFGGGVGMSKIYARKNIKISQSNIQDRFILSGSNIEGALIAPALTIGTWGSIAECRIQGYTDLGGLKVGKKITTEDKEKLQKYRKQEEKAVDDIVPGSFYMSNSYFHKEVNLFSTNVKGDLCLDNVNSHAEMDLNTISVGNDILFSKAYFRGMIRCENVIVKGKLYAQRSRFKEEVSWNGIKCQMASLRFSSFDGGFTMRYGRVEKELHMYNTDVDGKVDLFRCKFGDISFNHMLVDHFLIDRRAIGDELTSEKNGEFSNAVTEYGILKQSFHQRNDYENMDWAYYRFCRSKRKMKKTSWKQPLRSMGIFFDWLFLDKGFGYGTRPMNIAAVAFSCILAFAVLFSFVPSGILGADGALTSISFADSFYLSITTFASMDYGNSGPVLNHWLKHLFSLEGILGIFLTTLFVATISRKIIRS
ncbi:potassium channel family protein [Candidatus Uabimicrobium sp. HlEnr_7]|uniref:potassium channel family protein n=1 Tax=Candidatus Uabimicrobium helgolandensis TaxID=3095367 RepID=UPI003556B72C